MTREDIQKCSAFGGVPSGPAALAACSYVLCLFSRWHPPTEGRLEYMACESGSGIVPRAGGNRGDVHAIAAGATAGAIALYALCLTGTRRSSPGPVPPAPARQCETEHWRAAQASVLRRGYHGHGGYWPRGKCCGHGAIMMHMEICTCMSTFT